VFAYTQAEKAGRAYKFARPFRGPYRVVEINRNVVDMKRIDDPGGTVLRVAESRLIDTAQKKLMQAKLSPDEGTPLIE